MELRDPASQAFGPTNIRQPIPVSAPLLHIEAMPETVAMTPGDSRTAAAFSPTAGDARTPDQPPVGLDDITLPLCLIDRDGAILWANAAFWMLAPSTDGISRAGTRLESLLDPRDRHRLALALTHPVELRFGDAGGRGRRYELRRMTLAGPPATPSGGGRAPILLAAIDVEARSAEAELDTALREELAHRLRNLVTLVAALTTNTLGQNPSSATVDRLLDRLRSLQTAGYVGNEVLDAECSVARIAQRIINRFHDSADHRVLIEGDDIAVSRRWGNTLALILHELATNCIKHGALTVRTGMVTLRWCTIAEPDRTMLHVEWREMGGPLVREPATRGHGLAFVEKMLSASKDARAAFRFAPTGFVCQLDLPIEHRRRRHEIMAEPHLDPHPNEA